MALGFDVESILAKVAENPAIKKVIAQVQDVCNGIILAMAHFNKRFDTLEAKVDRAVFLLEHPSQGAPAGPDGLMALLAADGQEMKMQTVEPMSTEVKPNGEVIEWRKLQ
jgi:hypothetical protein